MKQFIVMCSSIALGLVIYNIIVGNDDGSIFMVLKSCWSNEVAARSLMP